VDQDKEWALSFQRGDPGAFNNLVIKFKKPIYNLAFRMLNSPEDANDIAQETFLRVYQYIEGYDSQHKFSTWIFAIASRLCIDRIRKVKGKSQELDFEYPDPRPLPEEIVIQRQLKVEIDEAINLLPEKYKLVLILRHVNELTYEEISVALAIPVNTVKTHLFRGRDMLKKILETTKEGEKHG
jgi:RNA polymerase sigma-70 factor, ECF subfamily